jgi:sugar phosphate isomerase/epimerase
MLAGHGHRPWPQEQPIMKLSVSTYSLARWRREQNKSLEHTIDWIADAGVSGIEFSGLDEKAKDNPLRRAAVIRRRCEKRGLPIVSYCIGAELLCDAAEQRQRIEKLKQEVDLAAALGAPSMRHDVTRGFRDEWQGARSFAVALKTIVPAIREVADYAATRGVRTSLENHGFYMQEPDRVEKLIKTVCHDNFGLTIDMGNFLCVNADPVAAVKQLVRYAQMAHVKDFHVRPKNTMPPSGWFKTPTSIALRGAIVGHGAIDVPAQLKLLKQAGYSGYLSLEFEGMEEPTRAVALGLEYLRQQLTAIGGLD